MPIPCSGLSHPQLFSPHRLLSTTASTIPPKPFAVGEYLVATFGLSRPKALKASKKLSHLKSSTNPDAVIAFLSDLGLPRFDIAALVAGGPQLLCASVEKTLAPRVTELRDIGLSRPQIACLVPLALNSFHSCSLSRTVSFWLSVFNGSLETLIRALRLNAGMLRANIEKVAMPNLAFLQQCGLSVSEVAVMSMDSSRLFTLKPESLREAAQRVAELGIERRSGMFRHALVLVALMSKEDVTRKIWLLQNIGFSQDDALAIVRKEPYVLRLSEEKIRRVMHFLMTDVGLEAPYIAKRPALFMYSLEQRLLPRYFLLKILREKGLLNFEPSHYYHRAMVAEKVFVQKFVYPYEDHIPGLADEYASRCSGKALHQSAFNEVLIGWC